MTQAEQNHPILAGHDDARDDEKIDGILLQVGADLQLRPEEDLEGVLRRRFADAGVEVPDADLPGLVKRIPGSIGEDGQDVQPGVR